MRSKKVFSVLGAAMMGLLAKTVDAAPTLRVQVDQRGDFALIGHTLGHECASGTPAPVVGTVGACGSFTSDSAPDVFWRADDPVAGQAAANTGITVAEARSTAMLALPPGATVTHAYLYWAGAVSTETDDQAAVLERPGVFTTNVTAVAAHRSPISDHYAYQSVADVTALVKQHGPGAYRVGGVDALSFVEVDNDTAFAGWWMAVFYELASEPPRNLALFDGLDLVQSGGTATATLSGFLVPNAGFDGKLGVVAFEGDSTISGDELFFNGGAPLSNAVNATNNFFNGTRSHLGAAVSVAGDLPQLTGGPGSMSGIDIDVVDITSKLTAGQSSAPLKATSSQDVYLLGGFVTAISTFRPDLSTSTKSVRDVNGGGLLRGDELEYTVVVKNTGNDGSVGTVLVDSLPAGVTFVPGSITIASGANAGAKTDAAGDDQADYDAATRRVTIRLGTGANGTQGGSIAVNESTTITFEVTVDANATGSISNQATITAAGAQGAPASSAVTDGNGPEPGNPPASVDVDGCDSTLPCVAPKPFCKTDTHPYVCVECGSDTDCPGLAPTCSVATNTCTCVASGAEECDGKDNDCNGVIDEGFPSVCASCTKDSDCGDAASGRVCNDTNHVCVDGCRGQGGNGCRSGVACSSKTSAIGTCIDPNADGGATSDDDILASGNGILCDAQPTGAPGSTVAWLTVGTMAVLVAARRRRPKA